VAEAYEEAKSTLGTAETSFLMLVIMRIIFLSLFVIYRARMFCIDLLELITGRQFFSASRQASRTVSCMHCLAAAGAACYAAYVQMVSVSSAAASASCFCYDVMKLLQTPGT
jgi:hypothetical protein